MASDIAITAINCILGGEESLAICIGRGKVQSPRSRRIDTNQFDSHPRFFDQGPFEMFRSEKILAYCLQKALRDAGIKTTEKDAHRCSILMGNTYGNEEFKVDSFKALHRKERSKFFLVPYSATNSLSTRMSILFNIKGANITFSSGAVSSSEAILAGRDLINDGKSDIVVVGGTNFLCDDLDEAFYQDGFEQESCGFLVLENKEKALARGKKIYATIHDICHGFSATEPEAMPFEMIERFLKNKNGQEPKGVILNRGCSFLKGSFPA